MDNLDVEKQIESLVKQVSELKNITNYKFESKSAVEKGDNFLGDVFRVLVKDQDSKKTIDLIMKLSFKGDKIREDHPIKETYENETYFYCEVFPTLDEFQKEKILSESFQNVPTCYLASLENKKEAIVMKNLKSLGYELFNKKLVFDDHHNRELFKRYGRFHALGFSYADQYPEEYKRLTSKILNVLKIFSNREHFREEANNCAKAAYDLLENKEIKDKFAKYVEGAGGLFFEMSHMWGGPYSTIIHGDCWSNNFMFKYDESKKIKDIKMLDWQLMKVASPIFDLSYMLYSGGSKDTYDKLDDYLSVYYKSFSQFAKELGSNPDRIFPFEILKDHWKKYAKYGLLWSLFLIRMKLTEKEDVVDLQDLTASDNKIKMSTIKCNLQEYNKRIKELITHLYEIDAL